MANLELFTVFTKLFTFAVVCICISMRNLCNCLSLWWLNKRSYSQIVDIQQFMLTGGIHWEHNIHSSLKERAFYLRKPQDNPGQPGNCQIDRMNLAPHETGVEYFRGNTQFSPTTWGIFHRRCRSGSHHSELWKHTTGNWLAGPEMEPRKTGWLS